jgi:hypothetical protein
MTPRISSRRVAGLVVGALLTIPNLLAQRPTSPPGTPPPNSEGTTGTTVPGGIPGTTSPGTPTIPSTTMPLPEMNRPIFLTGRVVLSDGSQLTEPVLIERVCMGNPHAEAYTDSKGRFSFQVGQGSTVLADASTRNTPDYPERNSRQNPPGFEVRRPELWNCELRASLPGYRSDVINLAVHRYMDNPDVGTIILHRMANVEGLTISATNALAPKDARKAYDHGRQAERKEKLDEAIKDFNKAVGVYPSPGPEFPWTVHWERFV